METKGKKTAKILIPYKPPRVQLTTKKLDTDKGGISITVTIVDGKPANTSIIFADPRSNNESDHALAGIISTALEHGVPIKEITTEMQGVHNCIGHSNSVPQAIITTLKAAANRKHPGKKEEKTTANQKEKEIEMATTKKTTAKGSKTPGMPKGQTHCSKIRSEITTNHGKAWLCVTMEKRKPTDIVITPVEYEAHRADREIIDALGRTISTALKYGAPVKEIVTNMHRASSSFGSTNILLNGVADILKNASKARKQPTATQTKNKKTRR